MARFANQWNSTAASSPALKRALYLAALLLLPGALIGAPLLWLVNRYLRKGVRALARKGREPPTGRRADTGS